MSKVLIFLYQEHVSDLQASITNATNNWYNCIITPMVYPSFQREFLEGTPMKSKHLAFSRSDLLLSSQDWYSRIITKLSDYIDCDSPNDSVRKHSEKTLQQEISFSEHLIQQGHSLIKINSSNTMNLARMISINLKGEFLEVPFVVTVD